MINGWNAFSQHSLNKVFINIVKFIKLINFKNKDAIKIFVIIVALKWTLFSIQIFKIFRFNLVILNAKNIIDEYFIF